MECVIFIMPDEKVMVFIDGSNLFHAIRRNGVRINYEKLRDKLVKGRNLIQSFYFCSVPPNPKQSQIDFLMKLRDTGYEVKEYKLRKMPDGSFKEKGVDVGLATELLVQAFNRNYDVGVVIAGDEDYKGVIGEAKRLGRKIEIASFKDTVNADFRRSGNLFIPLDDILPDITD